MTRTMTRTIAAALCGLFLCCATDTVASQKKDPIRERVEAFFKLYDKNTDNFVTESETGAKTWATIAEADTNRDKKVSRAELYTFWSRKGGCEVTRGFPSCGGTLTSSVTTGRNAYLLGLQLTRSLPNALGLVVISADPRVIMVGRCGLLRGLIALEVIRTNRAGAAGTVVGVPSNLTVKFSLQAATFDLKRLIWQSSNSLNVSATPAPKT